MNFAAPKPNGPPILAKFNSSEARCILGTIPAVLSMHITLYEIAVWLIVGLLGGTLAGLVVKRQKRGFGLTINLLLGLAGAVVGGLLFRLLGLFPNLDKISISMRDIVASLAGSLLILAVFWLWQRNAPPP